MPDRVVRTFEIPSGHAGIERTIDHMRVVAKRSAGAPIVEETAERIVGAATGREAAERIRHYLAARMVFEFDPPGVELIQTPELLVSEIACRGYALGDCDDVAVLGASLGLAAGLRPEYVLIGFTDSGPFEHVYTQLATSSGWVELDTTRPAHLPPELEIRRVERREIVPMYSPGLSGFWDELGSGLIDAAPQIVPGASPGVGTQRGASDRRWWEEGLEAVSTAAGEWAAEEIRTGRGSSTDPWGPGIVAPTWAEPGIPAPAQPAVDGSAMTNALLLGGLALVGLKLAGVL